jgi:hypothetical protein
MVPLLWIMNTELQPFRVFVNYTIAQISVLTHNFSVYLQPGQQKPSVPDSPPISFSIGAARAGSLKRAVSTTAEKIASFIVMNQIV